MTFSVKIHPMREIHPTNWLRYAGIATWMLVAATLLLLPLVAREEVDSARIFGWWPLALVDLVPPVRALVRVLPSAA